MIDFALKYLVAPIIVVFSVYGWFVVVRRLRRGEPVLAWAHRPNPPWGLLDLLIGIFSLLIAMLVMEWVLTGQLPSADSPPAGADEPTSLVKLLGGSLAYLAATAVSLLVLKFRTGAGWSELGLDFSSAWRDIKLGLAAFAMLAPIVFTIQLVLVEVLQLKYKQPLIEQMREAPGLASAAVTVFAAVIAAPLAEEYFFRLLLQGWLEKAVAGKCSAVDLLLGRIGFDFFSGEAQASDAPQSGGSPVEPASASAPDLRERISLLGALALSSGLFALAHASQGWAPTIPLFIFSVGIGFLYQRTRRLLPCIMTHLALNACSTAILLAETHSASGP